MIMQRIWNTLFSAVLVAVFVLLATVTALMSVSLYTAVQEHGHHVVLDPDVWVCSVYEPGKPDCIMYLRRDYVRQLSESRHD